MRGNKGTSSNFNFLVRDSAKITKTESPFSYSLGHLLFLPERKDYLFLAYAYFRWLDDYVDQVNIPSELVKDIVDRQIFLATHWYSGEPLVATTSQEENLHLIIQQDSNQWGNSLRPMIFDFMGAIKWDTERRYRMPVKRDLQSYSLKLGRGYSSGLLFGLGIDPENKKYVGFRDNCGIGAHLVHILRDFIIDINIGYINVDLESWNLLHLKNADLDNTKLLQRRLLPWAKTVIVNARYYFSIGLKNLLASRNVKIQLVFGLMCLRYLLTLEKTKREWERKFC